MITYTYIVRCPECEDEFFDFFDEAKEFAIGCLTKKPIITQTEVERNDFGECTDHCDLGTVWSWEDMMKDTEPEDMVFSKDETFGISEGLDDFDDFDIGPQIDEFDNSLDFEIEDDTAETLWVAENLNGGEIVAACWADSEDLAHRLLSQAFRERTGGDLRDCYIREAEADEPDYITDNPELLTEALTEDFDFNKAAAQCSRKCYDFYEAIASAKPQKEINKHGKKAYKFVKDQFGLVDDEAEDLLWRGYIIWKQLNEDTSKPGDRKPIPEGMTIEQLVEEMEENEDTVECVLCQDLFDKSTCRKELNLGWLCRRCADDLVARGEGPVFKEDNYWDFLDEDVELTESTLTEAAGYDCPKLKEADNNKPGIAKFKILYQFRKNPDVQGPYGDCPYLSSVAADATFRNVKLEDSARFSYGEVHDITLADNGEVILTTTNGKTYSLRQALRIASPVTDKFSNTRKVLLALKAAADAAEKTLDTKTVRNLRVRNALEKLDDTVANEFKAHIKNITFRIPAHNAYSADDILDIDPDASEQQAELAAERINRIHDAFYSLPFAMQAEELGMVEERIPAENVGWILSSWGAVGKIRFDCPISSLSKDAQDIIKKAKLSEDKVKTEAFEVDCYRLATELIRFFGNDPKFYEKPVKSKELVATDVDEAFDLDFPEV